MSLLAKPASLSNLLLTALFMFLFLIALVCYFLIGLEAKQDLYPHKVFSSNSFLPITELINDDGSIKPMPPGLKNCSIMQNGPVVDCCTISEGAILNKIAMLESGNYLYQVKEQATNPQDACPFEMYYFVSFDLKQTIEKDRYLAERQSKIAEAIKGQ
ncbi:hypothetical protein OCF84_21300 (plasmid) [Shewanella xiamenensis]|uniref:Uncharacterized protein n=1 Tax=Shewanella xiamenensis TaxID=332186 RepID=A0ABT6UGF8_9GAMM|nr:hypothetical protein [Shewanella xiamenensis]MDI5832586.1 hypothetical protein [Shewanella xiamenensis]WHF57796.1 hypothetical protein OCF84_21300 [Shewanella xiamenensis]